VFDEARYFEPGVEARLLEVHGVRMGVSVCEDVWADPDRDGFSLYHRDPVAEMVDRGAQLLVNISASPFELGKAELRRDLVRRYATSSGRFFLYANQVGGNDELVFDGHSLVWTARAGWSPAPTPLPRTCWSMTYGRGAGGPHRARRAGRRDPRGRRRHRRPGAGRARARGAGLCHKCGFERVLLGLSGGIDSALVAAIAARALGPANVLGVTLPTRYSSAASVTDSKALAERLGIDFRIIPIDDIFHSHLERLAPVFEDSTRTSPRRTSRPGSAAPC